MAGGFVGIETDKVRQGKQVNKTMSCLPMLSCTASAWESWGVDLRKVLQPIPLGLLSFGFSAQPFTSPALAFNDTLGADTSYT